MLGLPSHLFNRCVDFVPCIYLRVLVFLVFLGFLRDFRRVLFAPPPSLGEALGEALGDLDEPLGEALGEDLDPRSTFFCNLKSYSNISLIPI